MVAAALQQLSAQLRATSARLHRAPAAAAQRTAGACSGPVRMVPVDQIAVRSEVFQFRVADSATGTCGRLRAAPQWSQPLAGALLVWRDQEGQLNLVDGHHRLELAKRDGVPRVAVLEIEAADPAEAKLIGAVANVAAGQAEAPELARLLRALPELQPSQLSRLYGVPRNCKPLADAARLRALDAGLFGEVACGLIGLDQALALAGAADHQLQRQLWAQAQRRRWDAGQLSEAAALAQQGPAPQGAATGCLPGLQQLLEAANPHLDALLAIRAAVRAQLRLERRASGVVGHHRAAHALERTGAAAVDQQRALEVKAEAAALLDAFSALAGCSGELAELLHRLAAEVMNGAALAQVVEEGMDQVRRILALELG